MGKSFDLEILGWDSFNPRKDIKRPAWFAFSNRMIEDPEFFSFNPIEFKAWIYLLSLASQKNAAVINVNSEHADRVCGISLADLESAIKKLSALKILRIAKKTRTPSEHVRTESVRYRQTEQNKQTEQNITGTADERPAVVPQRLQQSADFNFFNSIKEIRAELAAGWTEAFPEEWVLLELTKARLWCLANPKKQPRASGPFITNWLAKGWESYRKNIPSNKTQSKFPELDYSVLKNTGTGAP